MVQDGSVLVLVDLQHWIVEMPWAPMSGPAVVESCARLRAAFDAAGAPVVVVRYLRADGADGGVTAARNQVVGQLAGPDDDLVTKQGLDAFEGTDLGQRLDRHGARTVVVAGLSTAHGVAATAATAAGFGFDVVVVTDATASVTPAEHRAALDRLTDLGVSVRTVPELVGAPAT